MRKIALFTCGLFLILLLLPNIAGPVGAAEVREVPPLAEVPVNLRLVDEEKKPLTGEKTVRIEVTRGGLKDPAVLSSGLRINDGSGHFVFITPATPGPAEIRIIDPETGKVLEKILFSVLEPEPPSRRDEAVLVTQVTGRAEIQPGARLLRSGEKLVAGVTVTTAADSWLNLELFDGSRIIVQPGTVLRFFSVKRGITANDKEIRLNLVSGQIFITAQDFTGEYSLFQVRTPGVDLYTGGRAFEVAVSGKGTEAVVYEGELLIEDGESGLLFPVLQGQKALLPAEGGIPNYSSHRLTAEMREDILRGEGFLGRKPTQAKTASPGSSFQTGASLKVIQGLPYGFFTLKPQFYNITADDTEFSFGLELPFFFNQATGGFRYGSLDQTIKVGALIDWLKYKNEIFSVNYDFVAEGLTYGYGLLFGDYVSKSNFGDYLDLSRRRVHLGANIAEGLRVETLTPWNIRSISPWDFDGDSLYVVRLEETYNSNNTHLQLGLTYIMDENFKKDLGPYGEGIADQGLALDAGLFVTDAFQPYVEAAILKSSAYGWGAEGGVLGKAGAFRYRVAGRYLGEKFHPNYFGGDYETNKFNSLMVLVPADGVVYGRPLAFLDNPVYKEGMGYYAGFGVTAGQILSLDLSYEDADREDPYFPVLAGKLELNLPLGPTLAISAGADYRCYQFTKFENIPDANTVCTHYVEIMLARGTYATYKNTYIPWADQYWREFSLEVRWRK